MRIVGKASRQAKAKSEQDLIKYKTAFDNAKKKAETMKIKYTQENKIKREKAKNEIEFISKKNETEINYAREMAKVEIDKFKETVGAIGPETIKAIARAGPETQAKLLKGLGLKGYMISDGKNPINLFNTANGMVQGPH